MLQPSRGLRRAGHQRDYFDRRWQAACAHHLRELLESGQPVTPLTRLRLRSPTARWLGAVGSMPPTRGKTVCNCVGISQCSITKALPGLWAGGDLQSGAACLARLQEILGCGTQCGSCIPEVKRLIASAHALA